MIPPNTGMFMPTTTRVEIDDKLTLALARAREGVASGACVPQLDIEQFRQQLSAHDFEEQHDLGALIEWTVDQLSDGLVHMTHPGYFGLFNPAPTFAAECADRITAAFNPQICVWSHAPVAVDIEMHVIEQIGRRAGLPQGCGGHFTSGGSEANNTAVICALTQVSDDFARLGARGLNGQPRLYVSRESHLAWVKIAHQCGIGRESVRLIETDGMGRMDRNALQASMQSDRNSGDIAVMVAATAGTTNAGMIDPLTDCAQLAATFGAWYHVDAAWGGALVASEQHRSALDGIQLADSITIDAHKWFATTMGTGMFLIKDKTQLAESFHVAASYMPSEDCTIDYYLNSMQWSRRFIGLRLFLSLACSGWQGYAQHVQHSIELIQYLVERLRKHHWSCANDSEMAVACLVPPAGHDAVAAMVERVLEEGYSWVSVAQFEHHPVMRVCVTNGASTNAHIDRLINVLTNSNH